MKITNKATQSTKDSSKPGYRVLLVGEEDLVKGMIPDGAVVTRNEVTDPKEGEQFELIIVSNVLQQAERQQVVGLMNLYRKLLVNRGQLIVVVPSLEWACREFALKDDPPGMAYVSIFGTDDEPNRCGFTLIYLRHAMAAAGYLIQEATSKMYYVRLNGVDAQAFTHVVIGIKDEYVGDPADSID